MTSVERPLHRAEVEFKMAMAWRRAGRTARAEAGYRQALTIAPFYTPACFELVDLLETQGRVEEARELCCAAELIDPLDGGIHSRRARLEARAAAGPPVADLDADTGPTTTGPDPGADDVPHVLFYTDHASIYGAEQVNHTIMLGLRDAGMQVTCAVAPTRNHLAQERVRRGIGHAWTRPDHVYDSSKPARSLTDASESRGVFRSVRPDLVVFGDGSPMSNLMPKHAAAADGIPFIVIVHCVAPAWAPLFADHLPALARAFDLAEEVVAVSSENLRLLRERFGLAAHRGRVVLNGRPARFFESRDERARAAIRAAFGVPDDAMACVTVGRLDWVKGHEHQLDALANLAATRRDIYLLWAGSGSLDSRLRARVLALGLSDRVRFLGERDDVPSVLDAADAFLLPSHFEGMPVAIMEAMAKGLPVAATAISGIPEELGDAGMLLPDPEADAGATVDALATVLARWASDPAERQRVGAACRARADRLFRQDRMIDEYLGLVRRAARRTTGAAQG